MCFTRDHIHHFAKWDDGVQLLFASIELATCFKLIDKIFFYFLCFLIREMRKEWSTLKAEFPFVQDIILKLEKLYSSFLWTH